MNSDAVTSSRLFRTPFRIALAVLILGVVAELAAILILNSGHFVFSLDDAYIHLALAENIIKGHYGINAGEFSSPSSSILWPFLLAPFTALRLGVPAALLLNLLSAIGALFLFSRILNWTFETGEPASAPKTIILVLLIPATNMIGLIFTGMEHSLQVFLAVLIVHGLIQETRSDKVSRWLVLGIIAAPLIRYENLALSAPALLYLFVRGHRKTAIFTAAGVVALVDAFSIFLALLDLEPFPTSVMSKSSIVATGGSAASFLRNLTAAFRNYDGAWNWRGISLVIAMLILLAFAIFRGTKKQERLFAGAMALAVFLHVLAGRYDWYSRYEIYIWTAAIVSILYLARETLSAWSAAGHRFFPAGLCAAGAALALTTPYPLVLITTPLGSNNIYEQHYQMRRFVVEYYKKPVAVNDLGYVSYRNPRYVLDLFGLGSLEAFNRRLAGDGPGWMSEMAGERDVHVAMIYEEPFRALPPNWRKVAELRLGKKRITPWREAVSFYAFDPATRQEIAPLLLQFQKTLPAGVRLTVLKNDAKAGGG